MTSISNTRRATSTKVPGAFAKSVVALYCDGDSHIFGTGLAANDKYTAKLNVKFSPTHVPITFNDGTSGARIDTASTVVLDAYMAAPIPGARSVLVFNLGQNDIAAGDTNTNMLTELITYISGRRSAGYSEIWYLVPWRRVTYTTQVDSWNAYVKNNLSQLISAGLTGIIDTSVISELQDPSNTTYFQSDQIHLKAAGQQKLVDLTYEVLV